MAAHGLKPFPLLARLDDTGMPLWKLYLATAGAGLLVAFVLSPTGRWVNADGPLAPAFTPGLMFAKLLINCALAGFTAFCCVALARSTETDLRHLAAVDPDVERCFDRLVVTRRATITAWALGPLALLSFSPLMSASVRNWSVLESIGAHLGAGFGPLLIVLVMPLVLGVLIGTGFVIVAAQVETLLAVARSIRVDLLDLDGYTAIAGPFMRYLMIVLFTFSGLGPVHLSGNPELTRGAWIVMGVFLCVFLPVLGAYFLPILVLRNRIRDAKRALLDALRAARLGQAPPPALSIAELPGVPRPDLLTQQLFVESRWEWPVAAHLQRVVLIGMLPPLSWAAAAIVEQLMFD